MTSWADLINALAASKTEIKIVPSMVKHEDLWDLLHRVEALEAQVRDINQVLQQVLLQLQNNNIPYSQET